VHALYPVQLEFFGEKESLEVIDHRKKIIEQVPIYLLEKGTKKGQAITSIFFENSEYFVGLYKVNTKKSPNKQKGKNRLQLYLEEMTKKFRERQASCLCSICDERHATRFMYATGRSKLSFSLEEVICDSKECEKKIKSNSSSSDHYLYPMNISLDSFNEFNYTDAIKVMEVLRNVHGLSIKDVKKVDISWAHEFFFGKPV